MDLPTKFPALIPQVPVIDLAQAIDFYQSRLGFALDWRYGDSFAGVSREEARLFLERAGDGLVHPVRVWINLTSIAEVDAIYQEWLEAGVTLAAAPEPKPWGIYEFIAEDGDGNSYRVFYDTATPAKEVTGLPRGENDVGGGG